MTTSLKPIYLKKVVSQEMCYYFTHALLRISDIAPKSDNQVPDARVVIAREYMFETLHERLWPVIEDAVGESLIPTYAYARLYSNGDILGPHIDREACEVSVTIQLGRSHHYSWPIYMGDDRFDLGEGDGVIYPGCDLVHWRDKCDGPKDYYSGQVFIHFVRKHGIHTNQVGDSTVRDNYSFMKNRNIKMETK